MGIFRRKKQIFSDDESQLIVKAIQEAEMQTSGEVRVFIERRCKYVDAIDRASQIFDNLEMEKTEKRNGVLFYMATEDHQLAIYADVGIHEAVGEAYWKATLADAINDIKTKDIVSGICHAIIEIGKALRTHFPYDKDTDKNELPDDIVFGK